MVKIYTKYGDEGETGLLYGGRVSKADPRAEAYGTTDEAVSALGLAKALSDNPLVRSIVDRLQRELFTVGAELATDAAHYDKLLAHFSAVTPEMTAALEGDIDTLSAQVELPRSFIVPGGSPASAALDVARTALRRAERRAVELHDREALKNPEILRYLNRTSDLAFMLARYEDRHRPPDLVGGGT
jgi:cob(I)alamin adenosyltransferase